MQHTAEELDRSVYRVSPDYPLDRMCSKKVEQHRPLVYSFRSFVRGIRGNASVSDNQRTKRRSLLAPQLHGKKIKSPPLVGGGIAEWWMDAYVARV